MSIIPFLRAINRVILNPLLILMFSVAFVVFFWGIVQMIMDPDGKGREDGRRNMLWGIVGMFIMVGAFGIIKLILGTFGIPAPPFPGLP